ADQTATTQTTQESYLGYSQLQYDVGTSAVHDRAADYHAPSTIPSNSLAFDGTWTVHKEKATAGDHARIQLQFTAHDVYLVLGGQGTVAASFDGPPLSSVQGNWIG